MQLGFASGGLGIVHSAWTGRGQRRTYGVDVLAEGSSLYLELGPDGVRLSGVADGRPVDAAGADPFALSVRRFLAAAASGDRDGVPCTPVDALGTLRVAVACERSLATGREVALTARTGFRMPVCCGWFATAAAASHAACGAQRGLRPRLRSARGSILAATAALCASRRRSF